MSRSVVQRLWDQYQSEDSVSEDLFQEPPYVKLSYETVPQSLQTTFQASGRRISAYGASSYRGGGPGLGRDSLGGHTDLHGSMEEPFRIVRPIHMSAQCCCYNDFILMDDNARPHKLGLLRESEEDPRF
ncbi:hypothetical protein TNCV_3349411 [Trichonephila clavipes]|nr:hypothetical protein TNCV_3349411 [Trichonephila clavipes]